MTPILWFASLILFGGLPSPRVFAADVTSGAAEMLTVDELAALIDNQLAAAWEAESIAPAPVADDAEFLRRLYLDLIGKIPPVSEVRRFLADTSPDKRGRLVEQLLSSATHATHLANTWRELLLAGSNNDPQFRTTVPAFESWLQLRFVAGIRYDRIVTELLTAPVEDDPAPQIGRRAQGVVPSPLAFYLAHERKPEGLADGAARTFLGLQVGCAQCHDHPFAKWKQEEFWALAAFFDRLDNVAPVSSSDAGDEGITIPDTQTTVAAQFLDGNRPDWQQAISRRGALAAWITHPDNPYFARATVNRLWAHFFGQGFVVPVDDLDEANAPSHPMLLETISHQFFLHGYDLEYVIRAITATQAYQLSSRTTEAVDPQLQAESFARMPLKRLTAEQLFDSLVEATGYREPAQQTLDQLNNNNTARAEFVRKFTEPGQQGSQPSTSIIQALTLMNGDFVADATSLSRSEMLLGVVEAPFLDDGRRIETLFLATLGRLPTLAEAAEFTRYVSAADSTAARREALGDVFWALLNSAEFGINH